jgi:hypothetical protein
MFDKIKMEGTGAYNNTLDTDACLFLMHSNPTLASPLSLVRCPCISADPCPPFLPSSPLSLLYPDYIESHEVRRLFSNVYCAAAPEFEVHLLTPLSF